MSDLSVTSALQSGFQQLSSVSAKRNAEQAEQLAQALRKQADSAQAMADKYEEKAQALDSRANQAQGKSDDLNNRLTLSDAFRQAGEQVTKIINEAEVQPATYSASGLTATTAGKASATGVGGNIDTVA